MLPRLLFAAMALGIAAASAQAADDKTIYLTFDDGPLEGTATILKVLDAEQVPAALCMVGNHVKASAGHGALLEQAKGMPLVTICNHSESHANNHYVKFYASAAHVVADLEAASVVLGLTDAPIHARLPGRNVFRMPNLSRDDYGIGKKEEGLEKADYDDVAADGYNLYGWDHEWAHENSGKPVQSVDKLLAEIDAKFSSGKEIVNNNLLLLMHDEMFQAKFDGETQLTGLIAGLKSRGYAFGHIEDYDD